jgi:hypothetical protein
MTKPPRGSKSNKGKTVTKEGGSPQSKLSSTNVPSSSTSSGSSNRAAASRTHSPTTPRTTPEKTNNDGQQGIWMETATPGKFSEFQRKIFPVIEFLTSKPAHAAHAFTKRWHTLKRTPNIPMAVDITWRHLKILLTIDTMFQYRDFLAQCPDFSTIVTLRTSKSTKSGFDFGIKPNFDVQESPDLIIASVLDDDSSYVFDVHLPPDTPSANIDVPVPSVDKTVPPNIDTTPELDSTPRQHNIVPSKGLESAEDTDGSITTAGTNESVQEIVRETLIGFTHVHYKLFDAVNMWMLHGSNKRHPFYLKWQKAIYAGLSALSKWDRVAKLFGIAYLQDYVTLMHECPCIQEQFELIYDYFDNTVTCRTLALPDTDDVLKDITKFNGLQRKLQSLHFKFDSCLQQYNTRLADIDARIASSEMKVMDQLNRATSKFAASASSHYHSFTEFATDTFTKFKTNLSEYSDRLMNDQRSKLIDMHQANHTKIQHDFREAEDAFNLRLEQAIERAIQEILTTADDATDNINAQAESMCQYMTSTHDTHGTDQPPPSTSWRYSEPKPSKLFPNVDTSKFTAESRASPKVFPDADANADDAELDDDFGPFPTKGTFPQPEQPLNAVAEDSFSLQPVNHHDMLKRVQLPYPGREQSYIWYLQLKSNSCQYGVYLLAIEDFKKDKSLCPIEVYGIRISLTRYNMMKTVLYHFLAQRTIITTTYTDLRNIINRHAVLTDGYQVLYEIMERIHPALDPDVIFTAPQCKDYSDIHEYYTYMSSFVMHEEFAGRHYSPREQLNYFIRGLDSTYNAAIKRIRSQMDGWKASNPNVPDNLVLANLPNLVEKYLEEDETEGTQAIVRRFGKSNNARSQNSDDSAQTSDLNVRQYVDTKCPLCQTYGHHKYNCDRMAIWLHLKEGAKLVDDKLKTKLHIAYAELDNKRRSRKLNKLKGTVRQLYQNGQFAEGENLLNNAMTNLENPSDTMLHANSDDSDSSSDS